MSVTRIRYLLEQWRLRSVTFAKVQEFRESGAEPVWPAVPPAGAPSQSAGTPPVKRGREGA